MGLAAPIAAARAPSRTAPLATAAVRCARSRARRVSVEDRHQGDLASGRRDRRRRHGDWSVPWQSSVLATGWVPG
jgi:hypothetical protein